VPVTKKKPYSMDRNFMHISYEGGILEDPNNEPDNSMFLLTTNPEDASDKPEYVTIGFEKGIPVSLNGKTLDAVSLMREINKIGGRNGIGRVDLVENRLVGIKSRGVYETPGVTLLIQAHKALESLTLDRDTLHYKQGVGLKYAELVYNGMWFHPLKEALDAFIDSTQIAVTGEARLKLYKGNATTVGRKSPYSMYSFDLATFEESDYNQSDATGFINLYGLQLKEAAKIKKLL
jgi:argininosuccinate synthase